MLPEKLASYRASVPRVPELDGDFAIERDTSINGVAVLSQRDESTEHLHSIEYVCYLMSM